MEYLRSFLRRHFAGKPLVASPNVGCFLKLQNRRNTSFVLKTFNIILHKSLALKMIVNCCLQEVRLQKIIEDVKERYCNYLNGQHILVSTFINPYSNVKGTLSIICQTIKSGLSICDF